MLRVQINGLIVITAELPRVILLFYSKNIFRQNSINTISKRGL